MGLPRIWQAILRGNVPEQDTGAIVFSFGHFLENARDYFPYVALGHVAGKAASARRAQ